jgi:UDP-GlcNAc:undecaprenyl-phosphate GlcNAc-1-phosphate transferase
MLEMLCICSVSCGISLALTPFVRRLADRFGLVDRPDGHRKLHGQAIPVAGGLAVLLATGTAVALALARHHPKAAPPAIGYAPFLGLLLASVWICLLGIVDAFGRLRGRTKLAGQMLAACIVMAFGVRVHQVQLFGWHVELGLLSLPFTAFLLLGAINSLNLLDGMDGLLSSVGVIISVALAALAALNGHWLAAGVASALAGALLGFLRYNLPPASIFLGDCGSMFIGLVVGVLAILSSRKGHAGYLAGLPAVVPQVGAPLTMALTAPLALLTIPIFDTVAAIIRRKLTGRSLFATDRGHLHHCLLGHGLSIRRALLLVGGLCLVTAAGALASLAYENEGLAVLSSLLVVAGLVGTRLFGYAELCLVLRRLRELVASLFVRLPPGQPREVEVRLQGGMVWKDLWCRLTDCAEDLGLNSLHLDINAPLIQESYHAVWDRRVAPGGEDRVWRTDIPLTTRGHAVGRLRAAGERGPHCLSTKVAYVAQLAQEIEAAIAARVESAPAALDNPSDTNGVCSPLPSVNSTSR